MHTCTYSMYFARALCCCYVWMERMRKPACFAADRTGGSWCFLCILVGVCASVNVVLALFIYVCLREGKRDWKKKVFLTAYRLTFSSTQCRGLSLLATQRIILSMSVSVCHRSMWLFRPFVSESVCSCVCVCSSDEIASPPPLPPPNIISLPLGLWQTHQTGRK